MNIFFKFIQGQCQFGIGREVFPHFSPSVRKDFTHCLTYSWAVLNLSRYFAELVNLNLNECGF